MRYILYSGCNKTDYYSSFFLAWVASVSARLNVYEAPYGVGQTEVSPPSKSWCLDWAKTGCHLLLREDFFQTLPRHLSLGSSNSLLSGSAGSGVLEYTAFSFEEAEVRISCYSPKSPCGFWSHASLSHLSTIRLSLLSHHRNFFMISRHLQQFVPS